MQFQSHRSAVVSIISVQISEQFQSSFGAVLELFQTCSRVISIRFFDFIRNVQSRFEHNSRAFLEQLQSDSRSFRSNFIRNFRSVSMAIYAVLQGDSRAVSERFGSSFRAISFELFKVVSNLIAEQFESSFRATPGHFRVISLEISSQFQ